MELGVGLVRVSRKESTSVPGRYYGEFDMWIYGIEVLLEFVDLIFPGSIVDIINMPEPFLINVGDVRNDKGFKMLHVGICNDRGER